MYLPGFQYSSFYCQIAVKVCCQIIVGFDNENCSIVKFVNEYSPLSKLTIGNVKTDNYLTTRLLALLIIYTSCLKEIVVLFRSLSNLTTKKDGCQN